VATVERQPEPETGRTPERSYTRPGVSFFQAIATFSPKSGTYGEAECHKNRLKCYKKSQKCHNLNPEKWLSMRVCYTCVT